MERGVPEGISVHGVPGRYEGTATVPSFPPDHGLNKDAVRADMQRACAIVHGRGAKLSLLELCVLVMKDGLLSERERERVLAERLGKDTT